MNIPKIRTKATADDEGRKERSKEFLIKAVQIGIIAFIL
jgi:hypothetical protein